MVLKPEKRERNERTVRRFFDELVGGGDYGVADEVLTENYVRHELGPNPDMTGREAFVEFVDGFKDAFGDARVDIDELLVVDDYVVVRATERGTHDGEFMGIEPTGNEFEIGGIVIHRLEDGKIAETYACWDLLDMLRQLGVDPVAG
ncbi:ester cyclase [Haloprofundus sp. MHR1]|uniref:ester cyclase n=1 Tax=Haloprofundus sp. MHR1 TaxID=2572921 RepID=UPI0010BEAE2F|nr:ester cyclase [Haloprofundus sp. MHR1]QCJ48091.1 ester cyclase [Haloprofundus sp. MHR1]